MDIQSDRDFREFLIEYLQRQENRENETLEHLKHMKDLLGSISMDTLKLIIGLVPDEL